MASVQTNSYSGRYLKLTVIESSTSIEDNTSILKWTLESIGGSSNYYDIYGCKVVIDDETVYGPTSTSWSSKIFPSAKGSISGTKIINHKSDGTADDVSFSLTGSVYYNNPQTYGASISLTDIQRQANINTAPDFNDEENPRITYTNSAGDKVSSLQACISLTGSIADISYRDIPKIGTEYTFNLTNAERNVLRNACVTSSNRNVIFIIKTVIGNNTFYSSLTKKLTIINANPTYSESNVSYQDTNSTIVAITGNNQHIVRNNSTLRVILGTATANKGASISRYEVTFNGSTQNKSSAGNIDYGTVNLSSNSTLIVKVIDSRGNSTTVNKTITILDWILPSAIISANRKNNYEDETTLSVNASYSSVNNKNSINSIKYRYKKTTDTSYSSDVSIPNNSSTILNFDKKYAWNIQVEIKDKFGIVTYNIPLTKGTPIMFIDVRKLSVAINGFPTEDGGLDVYGKIKSNGKLLQSYYELDLSSLDSNNFYPITFPQSVDILDCEIHSPSKNGYEQYNQNIIHFQMISDGYSDVKKQLNILGYTCYDNTEITIGCIGGGGSAGRLKCVWLRGGLIYKVYSNFEPTIHSNDFTQGNETYAVGTNYYGGNNNNVVILFTPQNTLSSGSYFSDGFTAGPSTIKGDFSVAGIQSITSNGNTVQIGAANSSFGCHFMANRNFYFNHDIHITGDYYGGSNYNRKLAYEDQLPIETVLYNNSDGDNGDITLSDSVANYKYIEIYYMDNNGRDGGYAKLYNINGKNFDINLIEAGSSNTFIRRTGYTANGTSLIVGQKGFVNMGTSNSTTTGTNYLYITRVVGLK